MRLLIKTSSQDKYITESCDCLLLEVDEIFRKWLLEQKKLAMAFSQRSEFPIFDSLTWLDCRPKPIDADVYSQWWEDVDNFGVIEVSESFNGTNSGFVIVASVIVITEEGFFYRFNNIHGSAWSSSFVYWQLIDDEKPSNLLFTIAVTNDGEKSASVHLSEESAYQDIFDTCVNDSEGWLRSSGISQKAHEAEEAGVSYKEIYNKYLKPALDLQKSEGFYLEVIPSGLA